MTKMERKINSNIAEHAAQFGITEEELAQATQATYDYIEEYRLQEVRKSRNLTQQQVAERIGVKQNRVSDIENCRTASLSLGTLKRYADAIDCDIEVLIKPRPGVMGADFRPVRVPVS